MNPEEGTTMADISVAVASDHAGFDQKRQFVSWMLLTGIDVHDLGPYDEKSVDYPDYAALVAHEVSTKKADLGILICGTGIGMAMTANKFPGVRAANVTSAQFAELAREHNDANLLCLSGRFVDYETNKQIIERFFSTPFAGGRHNDRVRKILDLEKGLRGGGTEKTKKNIGN